MGWPRFRTTIAAASRWRVLHQINSAAAPREAIFPTSMPLQLADSSRALQVISKWTDYKQSPLVQADALAAALEQKLAELDQLGFRRALGKELQYPEFTESSDESKWEGKFSRSGFIHAALATKQSSWLGEYNQADLDFVNSELKRLGGFELLSWAGMNRVDVASPSAVIKAGEHERAVGKRPALKDAVSVFDMGSSSPRAPDAAEGKAAMRKLFREALEVY